MSFVSGNNGDYNCGYHLVLARGKLTHQHQISVFDICEGDHPPRR